MSKLAFALRSDYEGTTTVGEADEAREVPVFLGGVIVAGERDLNVAELLEAGNGTIVVSDRDPRIVAALDEYPALKRVEVPKGADSVLGGYEDSNLTTLRAEAKRRELDVEGGVSKANRDTLIAALEADDQGGAGGTNTNEEG